MSQNKFFVFGALLLATLHVSAEQTPGNKMCNYLSSTARKGAAAADNVLSEMSNTIVDVKKWERIAVNSKFTFEKFKALVLKETGITVSDDYKTFYINAYVRQYCGNVTTEAGLSEGGKSISSGSLKSFTKDPDVEGHAYYEKAKAAN